MHVWLFGSFNARWSFSLSDARWCLFLSPTLVGAVSLSLSPTPYANTLIPGPSQTSSAINNTSKRSSSLPRLPSLPRNITPESPVSSILCLFPSEGQTYVHHKRTTSLMGKASCNNLQGLHRHHQGPHQHLRRPHLNLQGPHQHLQGPH